MRARLVAEAQGDSGIDLSGLWVARKGRRIVGALLTQVLAGRSAAIWAPEITLTFGRARTAAALVRAALGDFERRGIRIAQALVDESSPRHSSADLARGGLPFITDLVYLRRPTFPAMETNPQLPRFQWQTFSAGTEPDFRAVLQATYAGSLDMPELEGIRSLDDILASHREGGRFRPERWQVGHLPHEPGAAAIVLLSELLDREAWEVAYLGLTPEARGRGLGHAALAHALEVAGPHTPRLELAVDVRNVPAQRLYQSAGFVPFERRAVHLAALGPDEH
jgi:ribosomal protein S18 acetylase RimI-like enzyme